MRNDIKERFINLYDADMAKRKQAVNSDLALKNEISCGFNAFIELLSGLQDQIDELNRDKNKST